MSLLSNNKTYILNIFQDNTEKYSDIINQEIVNHINNLVDFETVNDSVITSNHINNNLYLNKEISAEYINNASIPATSVPSNLDYRFLVKNGAEYTYYKDKPKEDVTIDPFVFLGYNGLQYSKAVLGSLYLKDIYATELLVNTLVSGTSWKCYSYPFGGLSKANSYFFYVDINNNIKILPKDDVNVNIDYVEGFVYISTGFIDYNNIVLVSGFFNLEPMKIIRQGHLNIKDNINFYSDLYKIINRSDKNIITIDRLSETSVILSSVDNIFITVPVETNSITVDGIPLRSNQIVFIPKNTLINIEKQTIDKVNEYLHLYQNITNNLNNYTAKTIATFKYYDNPVTSIDEVVSNVGILIYKEIEQNTYTVLNPTFIKLFT